MKSHLSAEPRVGPKESHPELLWPLISMVMTSLKNVSSEACCPKRGPWIGRSGTLGSGVEMQDFRSHLSSSESEPALEQGTRHICMNIIA